jgi:predicted extracellular nuclease
VINSFIDEAVFHFIHNIKGLTMKHSIIALSVTMALSFSVSAEVMITEYVEGGGYNKAIELYNNGTETIDLSTYSLVRYKDGDETSTSMVALSGTISPAGVLVVRNSETATVLDDSIATITNGSLQHNGGDAVALLNGTDVIDIVGDVPTDSSWGKDTTLRRIGRAVNTVYDESDWQSYDKDNIDDLGNVNPDGEPVVEEVLPEAIPTTIMAIQGDGSTSPLIESGYESEDDYQVVGVVTAIQETALGSHLPVGFFLQDPDGDEDENTSDAIFVEGEVTGLAVGNTVTVQGKASEYYSWTILTDITINNIEESVTEITATPLRTAETDEDFDFTLERHEGMLIELDATADMHVTRTFSFDYSSYRNNMVAAYERVNITANQLYVPASDEADAQEDENEDRRLFIESFEKAENGEVPWYGDYLSASAVPMEDGTTSSDDYIRIDDTIDGLQGVVGYSYSEYRLYVTNEATSETFIHNNERTTTPEIADGELRIATFNVLNYFNSSFGGDDNPTGTNRGAETEAEFTRQGDKIAKAIIAMDADIVGLMEIENNGFGENSAIAHLVDKINLLIEDEDQHYTYVVSDDEDVTYIGTDAIANQVIYKASKVTLDTYRLIEMPEQHATEGEDVDNYQRDAITPTFSINDSDETITISVNHFKSKGSTCWEDVNLQNEEDLDGQGSCENLRVSAAQHLGTELESIEGHKLILGDLNSYANEDPILLLTELPEDYSVTPARDTFIGSETMDTDSPESLSSAFGFVNVIENFNTDSFSYSYNDEVGTLDYILVDADTAENNVVAAIDWNINATESSLSDYSVDYSGDLDKFDDIYRASDHDPAIVVLNFSSDESTTDDGTTDDSSTEDDGTTVDDESTIDDSSTEDESAGSFGGLSILLLAGLSLFRRKKAKA